MVGLTLRLVILAAWLFITGAYVAHQLGLGLAPSSDAGQVLARQLDRTLVYDLAWRPTPAAAWEKSGACRIGARSEDAGVRSSLEITITNQKVIPGAAYIRKMLGAVGGQASRSLRLRLEQILDSRMRLKAVEIDGTVFGITFTASGPVDHNGLNLRWKTAGQSGTNLLPDVRPEEVAGSELAAGLPAGLKVGARFTTRFASIDPGRLRLATRNAVFTVLAREKQPTAAGEAELLTVEMRVDDRVIATLWCDDAGTVQRQELADQGLRLELARILDETGRELWPKPAAEAK